MGNQEDINHLHELLSIKKRRKQVLEKQHATLGITADPHMTIQIDDLTKEIQELEQRLLASNPRTPGDERDIITAPDLLGASIHDLESFLGPPHDSFPRSINGSEELPDGGETRCYRRKTHELVINYDTHGMARGFQIVNGFGDDAYTLEHGPVVLARLGIAVWTPPDVITPTTRHWRNHRGYGLLITAVEPQGIISIVRVYQLPRP